MLVFDMPYDVMGVKNLWWVWHDTDSNIFDRMYWVPWTSYCALGLPPPPPTPAAADARAQTST